MSVLILCLPLHHRYQCSDRDSNPDQSLEIRSNTRFLLLLLSEKRDSNPRPPPWQGGALPTELFSHFVEQVGIEPTSDCLQSILASLGTCCPLLWKRRDLNPHPSRCKRNAQPIELHPQNEGRLTFVVSCTLKHKSFCAGNRDRTDITDLEGRRNNHYTIPACIFFCTDSGI